MLNKKATEKIQAESKTDILKNLSIVVGSFLCHINLAFIYKSVSL